MLNYWYNLSLDIRAIIVTIGFFGAVYLLSLAPIWLFNVVLILLFTFAIYMAARAVLTAIDLQRKWKAEEKEGNEK